jgi:hypothetical protein
MTHHRCVTQPLDGVQRKWPSLEVRACYSLRANGYLQRHRDQLFPSLEYARMATYLGHVSPKVGQVRRGGEQAASG